MGGGGEPTEGFCTVYSVYYVRSRQDPTSAERAPNMYKAAARNVIVC